MLNSPTTASSCRPPRYPSRPEAATKVNLPTWAWLDKAKFKEVSVTAQINADGLNIQATTTAKPVSLKLEPGTPDAETYPASGECTINDDGSIDEPYAKGKADQTPPCGVGYLRSGNGTFKLQATITWEITWTGTGKPNPTQLPNGTLATTRTSPCRRSSPSTGDGARRRQKASEARRTRTP